MRKVVLVTVSDFEVMLVQMGLLTRDVMALQRMARDDEKKLATLGSGVYGDTGCLTDMGGDISTLPTYILPSVQLRRMEEETIVLPRTRGVGKP